MSGHEPSGVARRQPAVSPLVVLVVLALVPALMLWALRGWAEGRVVDADDLVPEDATPAELAPVGQPALSTELLSFRRSGGELSRRMNTVAFQQAVLPLLGAVNDRSCAALSIDGQLIGERNLNSIVIPASNQKVLVAAVAVEVLGPAFTYRTTVVGPQPSGGVVAGDVYLVGGGDPVLTSEAYPVAQMDRLPVFNMTSLDQLARNLATAGVTEIRGVVRGDGSRYDDEFYVDSWGGGIAGIEAGPYDALLVNDARVLGDEQRAADPNEAAAREFVRVLADQGISVTGGASTGVAPAGGAELAAIESGLLPSVIAEMLTNSDNNTAELMVKEIGLEVSGVGTRQAGLDAIASTIRSWGIDTTHLALGDGSGLSLDNRMTCATMLAVLQRAGGSGIVGQGLAVAGRTGTLADIFGETSVAGILRGKTGTLNNDPVDEDPPAVKALSGYLPLGGGSAVEYALILNGPTIAEQSEYRPVWAELATAFTTMLSMPGPGVLGPR